MCFLELIYKISRLTILFSIDKKNKWGEVKWGFALISGLEHLDLLRISK